MSSQSALGLGMIQFGLLVGVALLARHLLERHMSPDLVASVRSIATVRAGSCGSLAERASWVGG